MSQALQTARQRRNAPRATMGLGLLGLSLFMLLTTLSGEATEAGLTAVGNEELLTISSPDNDGLFIARLTPVANGSLTPLIGGSVTVNANLPNDVSVTQAAFVNGSSQIVYAASEIEGNQFNDLFVVARNTLGQAVQLNGSRNTAVDAPQQFAARPSSAIVAFSVRDLTSETDQLLAAVTTSPGNQTVINDNLADGAQISTLLLSPDGRSVAYRIDSAGGAASVWVSFTQGAENAQQVSPGNPGASFNPNEFAFSPDSRNFLWRANQDDDTSPEPLMRVTLDADRRLVGNSQQLNASNPSNERVIEFEVSADSTTVAYRAVAASSTGPADSFVVELDDPGDVTQINPNPVTGAGFTLFEDIEFFGGDVIYNSAQVSPTFVELFSVAPNGQGNSNVLSTQAPLNQTVNPSSLPGVSNMVVSRDDALIAIIDNEPAVDLFVLQPAATAEAIKPINFASNQLIDLTAPPPADGPPLIAFNFGADLLAVAADTIINNQRFSRELIIALPDVSGSELSLFDDGLTSVDQFAWVPPSATLVSSILPSSRSAVVGDTITAFATIINASSETAFNCSVRPATAAAIAFDFQFTNPQTNAPFGAPNTPIDLGPGSAQTYVLSATLLEAFDAVDLSFRFSCDNAPQVSTISGVNSLLLAASTNPVADIVALAATPTNNGFLDLDGPNASAAFSVATVNVGVEDSITVEIDSNGADLPLSLSLCETNPADGACLTAVQAAPNTVSTLASANQTQTFSFFVTSSDDIASIPSSNRLRVLFRDSAGAIRGQTSVAVRTNP